MKLRTAAKRVLALWVVLALGLIGCGEKAAETSRENAGELRSPHVQATEESTRAMPLATQRKMTLTCPSKQTCYFDNSKASVENSACGRFALAGDGREWEKFIAPIKYQATQKLQEIVLATVGKEDAMVEEIIQDNRNLLASLLLFSIRHLAGDKEVCSGRVAAGQIKAVDVPMSFGMGEGVQSMDRWCATFEKCVLLFLSNETLDCLVARVMLRGHIFAKGGDPNDADICDKVGSVDFVPQVI